MKRIIGTPDTGKTKELVEAAYLNNGIIVCKNAHSMRDKSMAYHMPVPTLSYSEFLDLIKQGEADTKQYYIDELESFMTSIAPGFMGYAQTLGEKH